MERLQSQLAVLLVLPLLLGCGQDRREEVTERYSTGQKKEVRVYEGEGTEEELIKRQTYTRSGELIRVENVAKGDTLYYGDLNPAVTDPEGLEDYLIGRAWTFDEEETLSFQFTSDSMFEAGEVVDDKARIRHIEYLSGEKKGGTQMGRIVAYTENEADTLGVYPMGPDSLMWGGIFPFKRVNRDVRQTARKYRRQKQREYRRRQQRLEAASQKLTLGPRGNQMKYDQDEFTVRAGQTVQIVYENTATSPSMRHNLVLLNKAPSQNLFSEIGQAAIRAGASNEYVPDHSAVLAATDLSKPGETVSVTFTAPEETGTYGFVCTHPGHWATGQGTMRVVRE